MASSHPNRHALARRLRPASAALGLVGAAWGTVVAVAAVGAVDAGLLGAGGRTGDAVGWVTLALCAVGAAGAFAGRTRPALASVLMCVASAGGFLTVGSGWLGPGTALFVASILAFVAIENPFADAMADERRSWQHAHDDPG